MSRHFRNRAAGHWTHLLASVGMNESFLTGKHGPCPVCGGKDRFRYDNKHGNGTWICTACGAGDGLQLVMKYRDWSYGEAMDRLWGHVRALPSITHARPPQNKSRGIAIVANGSETAERAWANGFQIGDDTPAGLYLRRRGILAPWTSLLGLKAERNVHVFSEGKHGHFPTMLAMFTAPDGSFSTAHRTFLTPEGYPAMDGHHKRFLPGKIAAGSAVRLSLPEDILGIAEGVETALSAQSLFGVPCWAAGHTAGLKSWSPPEGVRSVIIFADNDENGAGADAAQNLKAKLEKSGMTSTIRMPDLVGQDWNDVLVDKQHPLKSADHDSVNSIKASRNRQNHHERKDDDKICSRHTL